MVKVIITGVAGKMGGTILHLCAADKELRIIGAVEQKGHPWIGRVLEETAGPDAVRLTVTDDLPGVTKDADVIIDFTEPRSSLEHFRVATENGKAIVIGTTGFPEAMLAEIRQSQAAKVVVSPNMSVGVNLMFDLVGRVSSILREGYDVEILEMHHRWKKDAPSGTAMKIKDIVEATLPERGWEEVYGRKGITGERKGNEIAVLSLRGGDVVGEHTVIFAAEGERLEITHRAYSRDNFARGALLAAKWIVSQEPGVYSMKEVLGL
jgi:4-hydroxy-tetrahydrodipicolinate reductase